MFPIFAGANPSATGYNLTRSLRFRASATAWLGRTPATTTNQQTWTFSAWFKRGTLTVDIPTLFSAAIDGNNFTCLTFADATTGYLSFTYVTGGNDTYRIVTNQVFRDPSAWYHIVAVADTTNATGSNRLKLYINGVQITSFSYATYPPQNTNLYVNSTNGHGIGITRAVGRYYDGEMTEINLIDGQALTPSSFGSTNALTGVWQPAKYTGTYGTNGFYLPFTDNSALTTSSNVGLGKDFSGNANYWVTNNISITAGVTYDSMTDVPTLTSATAANFAVLNPLNPSRSTLTNGNLTASGATDTPTIIPTSGTYYFEIDGVSKSWTPPAAFPAAAGNYNFGQRPFTNTPTGTLLNTYNLPTSTIVKGNTVMDATTYTGTLVSNAITNAASFKPDLVWLKSRSAATDHKWTDSVRGVTKGLISDTTGAETTDTQGLTAFNTNGFTVGTDTNYNNLSATYVAWQWQAGQGSTASNTNGSITSTVSVNASAGFSIVSYTGTGAAATVGHGLGVTPSVIICKNRSAAGTYWHTYVAAISGMQNGYIVLNTTAAFYTPNTTVWNGVQPTSTVFSIGTDSGVNGSGNAQIAYCWTPIAGFSAFGSYTGNGSTDGPFVYTGFRPKFVMMKRTDNVGDWWMYDTSRSTYNAAILYLFADSSAAEVSDVAEPIDFLSNGFKLKIATYQPNTSGATYIYACFAENPFKNSLAR